MSDEAWIEDSQARGDLAQAGDLGSDDEFVQGAAGAEDEGEEEEEEVAAIAIGVGAMVLDDPEAARTEMD